MSSSMMSSSQVAFEPRDFMHEGSYPPMGDHHHVSGPDTDNFADPHEAVATELANGVVNYNGTGVPNFDAADDDLDLDSPPPQNNNHLETDPPLSNDDLAAQQQIKALQKPVRIAVRNASGMFACTWDDECDDLVREFARKCEWNKHMDKHERPYKCHTSGCEQLPGFTYAGGLLRHEREVHSKHGGPKKKLQCPHTNCKRHKGKEFSRQENLNEHLRRVHTHDDPVIDAEEEAMPAAQQNDQLDSASSNDTPPRAGQRRKRVDDVDDIEQIRQENKRLRQENAELHQQVRSLNVQTSQLLQNLHATQMGHDNGLTLGNGPML